ncbi:hypothetical protein GDO86_004109 [Hymenochirus boettgeri]|uniref:ATP-binding cassette sub-family C member 5 n=1 Tax=Hymenochirus boettgeri TaxID=247094 RepID=A0A8T2K4H6_9PIPI|nr:hypothetical protein GDO86_004109 [Hymenochirus boettgeri]
MISFMTLNWITPLARKAYKLGELQINDLWGLPLEETSEINCQRLQSIWDKELKDHGKRKASLSFVLWRFCRTRQLLAFLSLIITMTANFIGPSIFIRALLEYSNTSRPDLKYGLILASGVFVAELFRSWSFALYWAMNYRTGVRLKGAMLAMAFKKILKMKQSNHISTGKLVNICSSDGQRLFEVASVGCMLAAGPVISVMGLVYTAIYLGPSALLGSTVFVIFYPCMMLLSKLTAYFRKKCIAITDRRVRLMNEILNCIRFIKMYAWENTFINNIQAIRSEEKAFLEKGGYAQSVTTGVAPIVVVVASVCTFTFHMALGYDLNGAEAFTVVAVFSSMTTALKIIPLAVKAASEASVSISRFQNLLLMEEYDVYRNQESQADDPVELQAAYFTWNTETSDKHQKDTEIKQKEIKETQELMNGQDQNHLNNVNGSEYRVPVHRPVLHNINFTLKKGKLIGICGSVGSGKSSLILSILGQMTLLEGSVKVSDRVAYAAQQAWIFNASLRENILFGEKFTKEKYQSTLEACCLYPDMESLPYGDLTEVGERGANLSGGQRQRISLARALYSDRSVVLLDDPLSAVDVNVGAQLFNKAIKFGMQNRSVLFVTHQLQYLAECDEVIFMKDGYIEEQGTHEELMKQQGDYAFSIENLQQMVRLTYVITCLLYSERQLQSCHTTPSGADSGLTDQNLEVKVQDIKVSPDFDQEQNYSGNIVHSDHNGNQEDGAEENGKESVRELQGHFLTQNNKEGENKGLMHSEEKGNGSVSCSVFGEYIKAAGGLIMFMLNALLFLFTTGSIAFSNWWLSYWIKQGSGNTSVVTSNWTLPGGSMRDNPDLNFYIYVYASSVAAVLGFRFIRGYVFVKSTIKASTKLHDQLFQKVLYSSMKLFDTTPLGRILNRFTKDMDEVDARLPCQLEQLIQNMILVFFCLGMISFVFPWFLVSVLPLTILFCLINKVSRVLIRELKRLDNVTQSPFISHVTSTLHGITTIQAYCKTQDFSVKYQELLDINQIPCFLFSCATRWLSVRLDLISMSVITITAVCIALMHGHIPPASAGLAISYAVQNLKSEISPSTQQTVPSKNWPQQGAINFKNVDMRYHDNLPLVLKNISFSIRPKEKIGIVGRTGSGKSSLGAVLFKLVELEGGSVSIDNVCISTIGLKDLRERLSVLPQEPILFARSVRSNLDPLNLHTDEEVWKALERTHMKQHVSKLQGKLNCEVSENGNNFSVGERQLLCMARALLRSSKILLLDEATAAIDNKTDAVIQETIKEAFQDCTVLIIAHRINTILNCDRVMVMDSGKIVEFEKPSALLSNERSLFYAMATASEKI